MVTQTWIHLTPPIGPRYEAGIIGHGCKPGTSGRGDGVGFSKEYYASFWLCVPDQYVPGRLCEDVTSIVIWLAEELLDALHIAEPEIKPKSTSSPGGSRSGKALLSRKTGKISNIYKRPTQVLSSGCSTQENSLLSHK